MKKNKSAYVIMRYRNSPIMIIYPEPHEIWFDLKKAKQRTIQLNENAITCTYKFKRVKIGEEWAI